MIRRFSHAFRINDNKFLHSFRSFKHANIEIKNEVTFKKMDLEMLISHISSDIKTYLRPQSDSLRDIVHYCFSSYGKMIRPQIILLTAASFNYHFHKKNKYKSNTDIQDYLTSAIYGSQYQIALIGEMIHTASLIHDDLIDSADVRRGIVSCHKKFGPENAILGGDYILICASQMLAKIGNTEVVSIVADLINDLIKGEIMQLANYDNIDEKLSHYYQKTYRKTASLIANCCKAVTLLSNDGDVSVDMLEAAFEFGRHIGMTFQLIDDILDVTTPEKHLGKPGCGADMKMGLATGPVIFASQKFPQINDIIMRKLSREGDLDQILEYIQKAHGVEETKMVARMHKDNALKILESLVDSPYRKMLENLSESIFNRTR